MTAALREADGRLEPGAKIGRRWIVREVLGAGGHASVYRAEHEELGHSVAIKVLHVERAGSSVEEMLARFRREARIAARVRHRNVVRVFDFGELDTGSPYFVMELIDGEDLHQRLVRAGALPVAAVIDVACQALAGLGELGSHGVVHRDVKPGNVMLRPREDGGYVAKLVDFGIAALVDGSGSRRVTADGTVLGTPEYMSPEQIRGLDLDPRADVYGMGVVMYEALTGAPPFAASAPCATLAMALTDPPPRLGEKRPDCPPEIEAIVMRALAKEREERWTGAFAMAAALDDAARALGIPRGAAAWPEEDDAACLEIDRAIGRAVAPPISAPHRRRPAARARPMPATSTPVSGERPAEKHDERTSMLPAIVRIALALFGLGIATAVGITLAASQLAPASAAGPATE
jgi:serine/threonine-protein kinase